MADQPKSFADKMSGLLGSILGGKKTPTKESPSSSPTKKSPQIKLNRLKLSPKALEAMMNEEEEQDIEEIPFSEPPRRFELIDLANSTTATESEHSFSMEVENEDPNSKKRKRSRSSPEPTNSPLNSNKNKRRRITEETKKPASPVKTRTTRGQPLASVVEKRSSRRTSIATTAVVTPSKLKLGYKRRRTLTPKALELAKQKKDKSPPVLKKATSTSSSSSSSSTIVPERVKKTPIKRLNKPPPLKKMVSSSQPKTPPKMSTQKTAAKPTPKSKMAKSKKESSSSDSSDSDSSSEEFKDAPPKKKKAVIIAKKSPKKPATPAKRSTRNKTTRTPSVQVSKETSSDSSSSDEEFKNKRSKKKAAPIKNKMAMKQAVIPQRKYKLPKDRSVLAEAQLRLHVGSVPKSLPCREEEFAQINAFVENKILDGSSGCMYINGVPGTGKTATVREVVRSLKEEAESNIIPDFQFIELNGMRMVEAKQLYVQLWKALNNNAKVTADHAKDLLERRFTKTNPKKAELKKTQQIVLLVDELDMLKTMKQSVLYNLFEWPTYPHAKLIVLAIANTMDLPERIFMNRVTSRIGLTRVMFSPYNYEELSHIVASRVQDLDIFETDSIEFVARKVASLSGDARRALDICRRAAEMAEESCKTTGSEKAVGMAEVRSAIAEMYMSPKVSAVRLCSEYEKFWLKAMLTTFQKKGIEEASFDRVNSDFWSILRFEGKPLVSIDEAFNIVGRLSSSRLILYEPREAGRLLMKLRLNVSHEDLNFGLLDNDKDDSP